ncbi:Sulfurtransferase TusA [Serratia symbiotica]|nr:Sulfurtransferase TusA [Serratia symbiotica]
MHNLSMYINQNLNTLGLRCPEPIMMIRKIIRNMNNGDIVLITADDPSTIYDIPNFCYFMEHTLLDKKIDIIPYYYLLKKGI